MAEKKTYATILLLVIFVVAFEMGFLVRSIFTGCSSGIPENYYGSEYVSTPVSWKGAKFSLPDSTECDKFDLYHALWNIRGFFKERCAFRMYVEDYFDCSESSAFLEWALESYGFDAVIAFGPAPHNMSGIHTWVIVRGVKTFRSPPIRDIAIESTSCLFDNSAIVLSELEVGDGIYSHCWSSSCIWEEGSEGWNTGYGKFYFVFEDIYSCLFLDEFDWWEWVQIGELDGWLD